MRARGQGRSGRTYSSGAGRRVAHSRDKAPSPRDRAVGATVGVVLLAALAGDPALAQRLLPAPTDTVAATPDTVAATATLDTALLVLQPPAGWPAPQTARIWPDTLSFGDEAWLVLEFAGPFAGFTADSLAVVSDWAEAPSPWLPGEPIVPLPATESWRATLPLRLYRVGPLRVAWLLVDGGSTPRGTAGTHRAVAGGDVAWVVGRLGDDGRAASVRTPRALGWNRLALVALFLLALLLGGLIALLARRREREVWKPRDRALTPPPYLATAQDLRALEEEELAQRGERRRHLDRLAAILRRYISRRFRIAAVELTAAELRGAVQARGFPRREIEPFARLLSELDRRRYDPALVPADTCRRASAELVSLLRRTRIEIRFAEVPADQRVAGDRAWAWLEDHLGPAVPASAIVAGDGAAPEERNESPGEP